jgi:glycosyltransferase involved in cell wall biosynthesis
VVAQETRFDFEMIVGNDCSPDDTRLILDRLAAERPGRVKPIHREHNVGMQANFMDLYSRARGDYVAFLDGDDFWTDPHKLQKQVDFLDAHPDHSFCFHNVNVLDREGAQTEHGVIGAVGPRFEGRTTFGLEDLIPMHFVPSCSIVARNRLIRAWPRWLDGSHGIDWAFVLLHARHGPFARVEGTMATYRRHSGGAWTSLPPSRQREFVDYVRQNIRHDLPASVWPLFDAIEANAAELEVVYALYDRVLRLAELEKQWSESDRGLRRRVMDLEARYHEIQGEIQDLEGRLSPLGAVATARRAWKAARRTLRPVRSAVRRYRDLLWSRAQPPPTGPPTSCR